MYKRFLIWAIIFVAASISFLAVPHNVRAAEGADKITQSFVYSPVECGWWNRCPVPAPTLVYPVMGNEIRSGEFLEIKGLTWNNTQIEIYLDSKLAGHAQVFNSKHSDTAAFFLQVKFPSPGVHKLYAVARSLNGWERSPDSWHHEFLVFMPYPAPVLTQPTVDKISNSVSLHGFIRKSSVLEVSVDKKALEPVIFNNTPTTSYFSVPLPELSFGEHEITLAALDAVTGKRSADKTASLKISSGANGLVVTLKPAEKVVNKFKSTNAAAKPKVEGASQAIDWQPQINTQVSTLNKEQTNRLIGFGLALVLLVAWFINYRRSIRAQTV